MTHNANIPTSEVLNLAADLIHLHGWGKGVLSWDARSGGLCIEGGIIAALGLDVDNAVLSAVDRCPAYAAVVEYIGPDNIDSTANIAEPRLWMWNDRQAQNAEQVIEVLRATAAVEAAREDAALLAEIGRV